ncbi:hypothetical protein FHS43_004320 [Streptosporangium becharense]|uniref:Uncharacterized protein n=1 Tax=Streptosporangium becharense TaxID=1816182 RepID=A0A7W9ICS4_9ACTN|nr:hypothetical protein [Streptosporangium becharense]MBB2913025.1 hypothetical protein [Streptosporangium becharense]MBB5818150.1 hypothetical protein [Streptosporangium becharense]
MEDRSGHGHDRLVYKRDEEDLTVPPQRTDDTAPATGDPRPGDAPDGSGRGASPADVRSSGHVPAGAPATAGFPEATAGRPDDVATPGDTGAGTGLTDADLPDAGPAHTGPAHTGPAHAATGLPGTEPGVPAHAATGLPDAGSDLPGTGTGTEPGVPAHAGGTRGILLRQDAEDVRRRWQAVQASFVDDPRDSVERADALLDEVVNAFRSALEARTAELRGRWKGSGDAKDSGDTEELRTALRDYRAALEELLNISTGTR